MQLLSLHVAGFGSIRERTFTFEPGLNLVLGHNEAGKSTLLHCLAQMLMGKPSQYAAFPDVQPWDVVDRSTFKAELDVLHAGQRHRLTRRFAERGAKAVTLARVEEDASLTVITQDPRAVEQWISESFGISDDKIFYKVFCLSQSDMTPLKDNADLYEQLERAISGAEVALTSAVNAIDTQLKGLRRGVGERGARANWGPLQTAIANRQELETKLTETRTQDERLAAARTLLSNVDGQIAQAKERIGTLGTLLESERGRREMLKRFEDMRAVYDSLERQREKVETTTQKRDALREELTNFPAKHADPAAIRAQLAQITATHAEVERLQRERDSLLQHLHSYPAAFLDTLSLRAAQHKVESQVIPPWAIWSAVFLGMLGILLMLLLPEYFYIGIAVIGIGSGGTLMYGMSRGDRALKRFFRTLGVKDGHELEARAGEIDEITRRAASLELAVSSAQAATASSPNPTELQSQLEKLEAMWQELAHAEGALAALPSIEELQERRRPLSREMTRMEDELAALPGSTLSNEDETRYTRELADCRLRLDTLEREKREAEKAVAVGEASEREIVELEDALAFWQDEEARLLENEAALRLAREWLTSAGSSAHDMLAAPLAASIAPRFQAMTGGRYPHVHVTTNAKTLELKPVDARGKDVPYEQLSRGTRDQFLLAVRLALGEAIAGAGNPIYFLDDPLLHFDADRRREALAMLADLGDTRQIILVSHDATLCADLPAAHCIVMDAPVAMIPALTG